MLGFGGGLHPVFLAVLLAIVLIIFGPGKLPELGGAIGRSIKEFRRASNDLTDEVRQAMEKKGREKLYPSSPETADAEARPSERDSSESADKPDTSSPQK
jgi:sec-independent protein translocase protein TatA